MANVINLWLICIIRLLIQAFHLFGYLLYAFQEFFVFF